jgi:tRNA U38,U39,U40 pseudouridine synthase TruA
MGRRNVELTISYDGVNYNFWQLRNDGSSNHTR